MKQLKQHAIEFIVLISPIIHWAMVFFGITIGIYLGLCATGGISKGIKLIQSFQ